MSLLPHFNRDHDQTAPALQGETAPPRGQDHRARALVAGGEQPGFVGVRRGRNRARLLSARERRVLVRWLRRTANRAPNPDPMRRRREVLLCDRVAVARTDLLQIAVMLEHAHDPAPARVAAPRELLRDGSESSLDNTDVHISELWATLYYMRSGLEEAAIQTNQGIRPPELRWHARVRSSRQAASAQKDNTPLRPCIIPRQPHTPRRHPLPQASLAVAGRDW